MVLISARRGYSEPDRLTEGVSLYYCLFCVCRRVVILMDLDVLKTADMVGGTVGNPVPYNEGEYPL